MPLPDHVATVPLVRRCHAEVDEVQCVGVGTQHQVVGFQVVVEDAATVDEL